VDATSIWRRKIYLSRASVHVAFAVIVWPLTTLAGATATIMMLPYFPVSLTMALMWAFVGMVLSVPDMLLVGIIVFGSSVALFNRLGVETRSRRMGVLELGFEPLLTCVAIVTGASLWYPALLSVPLLSPFGNIPVAGLMLSLVVGVVVGASYAARPGKRFQLAAALMIGGMLSPVPLRARAELARFMGSAPNAVVLGIDSVSQTDDVRRLEDWVTGRRGAWYKRAVAPGLLTNAVWASVLTMKPVRTHGVFLTFLRVRSGTPAFLSAARAKGYGTVSAFSDQLTCTVGSRAGFDDDRSGPVGWRQLLLPIIANNSFMLPVVKPALPHVWPMAMPPNQPGTITYDVRREIREILRAGSKKRRILVTAHLTYAHLPAYPSSADLSWEHLQRIARAPAKIIFDRSFDWMDADLPTDPVPLHRWKIAHLQDVIASEVDAARYVDEGGQLVVFSDHGDRSDLSLETFHKKRYHHVLLATFGLPSRCTENPISLADIGLLLGLTDARTDPSVEFMYTPETLVPNLVKASRVRWSGDVDIDSRLAARLFGELRRHRPWPEALEDCESGMPAR
jgi:hypothetical protein